MSFALNTMGFPLAMFVFVPDETEIETCPKIRQDLKVLNFERYVCEVIFVSSRYRRIVFTFRLVPVPLFK